MDVAHIETIPFYENISAKAHFESKNSYIKTGLHTILPNPDHNNYIIRTEKGAVEFDFKNKQDKANLDAVFSRGSAHICNVKSTFKDGFLFDFYSFAGSYDFDKIEILAEEEKIKNLQNKNNPENFDELCSELAKACQIELDGEKYCIIHGNYKSKEAEDDSESGENEQKSYEFGGAFSILCERFRKCFAIKIRQRNLDSDENKIYFAVTSISSRKNMRPAGNFNLIKAELVFSSHKQAALEHNLKKLEIITRKGDSYLKAWQQYTEARGNRILENPRKFGAVHYISRTILGGTATLYFGKEENISDKIAEYFVEEVTVYKNDEPEPVFLQDPKCTFLEYCDKKTKQEKERRKNKLNRAGICCQIQEYRDDRIKIVVPDEIAGLYDDENGEKSDPKIPDSGYIVMSMTGEETQISRQQEAWNYILQGRAGINHLGNLLEGNFDIMPSEITPPKTGIKGSVYNKIFGEKKPPTHRQLEAIEMALRTPDIALIQGPPGTGKTTVITAILEMLNVQQDKRGATAGRVLATSYQHDAVENMIERIRVNSIPAWKYGKRRTVEKNYNEHIDKWCKEIEERVLSVHPDIRVSNEEETFHAYVADYINSPVTENKDRLLEYIMEKLPVTEEIASEARMQLMQTTDYDSDSYTAPDMLRKIRALRTTEKSFADDGTKRAQELYFALEDKNWFADNSNEENLLMNVICNKPDAEQLSKLETLKFDLLEEFSPRPPYVVSERDERVISLYTKAANFLESLHGKRDKKEQIVADWIQALRAGSEAFSRAIKDCDFVYAATSQQSASKEINAQKIAVEGNQSPYINLYDTVIIDEAARATPPDLLIPMCKAVKRIILVGDHRQLPQLIDDDICEDIYSKNLKVEGVTSESSENIDEIYRKSYELSLFELMFGKLKELELKDNKKRTITLDEQYRTHPVLGKFCSRLFYEPYGEGYKSPREAKEFSHSLPGIENKAAVWIDVPQKAGREEKCGSSRVRECEAECIVKYLRDFVKSQNSIPKEKKLSYGIITFYSAQRDCIEEELKRYRNELKDVTCKVGTVDAFQGMEFDVVFLSTVRTGGNIDFLTPNRLCVSMSRQKKVLIAVGCKDFVTSEAARAQKIPALSEFYDLCAGKNDEGYGAILIWKK